MGSFSYSIIEFDNNLITLAINVLRESSQVCLRFTQVIKIIQMIRYKCFILSELFIDVLHIILKSKLFSIFLKNTQAVRKFSL